MDNTRWDMAKDYNAPKTFSDDSDVVVEAKKSTASVPKPVPVTPEPPTVIVPSPWEAPELWSTLVFGDIKIPAIAVVDPKGKVKADKKTGAGANGGTITIQGRELSTFAVTIKYGFYWDDDDFDSDDPYAPLRSQHEAICKVIALCRPVRVAANAIAVSHPVFSLYGVKSVIVEDITGPKPEEDGTFSLKMDMIEYRAPKPPPKAGTSATTTPTEPTQTTWTKTNDKSVDDALNALNNADWKPNPPAPPPVSDPPDGWFR